MKTLLRSIEGLVLAVLLMAGATHPALAKDVKIGLLMPADSTGGCNRLAKSFSGRFVV